MTGYGQIHFLRFPIQRAGQCINVSGNFPKFLWWESFKHYRRWVQIMILCGILQLKIKSE